MSRRYRLVIFDFDGTLANSFPWFSRKFNELAERYRFRQLSADELEALRGLSSRQLIAHVGVPLWKLPLIARDVRQSMAREIDQISLFPGVGDMLRELSERDIRLAVVTSNSEANVRQVLGPTNARLIGHYGCSAALLGKRPALRRAVRATGMRPSEVLCIGDELRDLEAARAEQLAFGAVSWGYTDLEALLHHGPDEVFRSVSEIGERLR